MTDNEKCADESDRATQIEMAEVSEGIAAASAAASSIEKGNAGTCNDCGYEYKRIVRGLCAYCRDGRGIPDQPAR